MQSFKEIEHRFDNAFGGSEDSLESFEDSFNDSKDAFVDSKNSFGGLEGSFGDSEDAFVDFTSSFGCFAGSSFMVDSINDRFIDLVRYSLFICDEIQGHSFLNNFL